MNAPGTGSRPDAAASDGGHPSASVANEDGPRRASVPQPASPGAPAASPVAPPPSPIAGSALRRTFVSLGERDFRLLTISTVAIGFGQWGQMIGMNWLVFVLTGSSVQLGAVSFIGGLVALVLTPFGGLLADRYPRRTILIVATAANAAQAVVLAVLVVTGVVEVWHVYVFALLASVMMAMNQPARQAFVFDVSTDETLPNAIAMNSIAQNVSRIAGPPFAGALAGFSTAAPFVFVAAMGGFASAVTGRISHTTTEADTGPRRNPFAEIAEGFRYLGGDSRLLGLLVVNALPAMLVYPYISFMPVVAEEVLGGGAFEYSLLVAMIGVGSVIGLVLLAFLGNLRHQGAWMLAGLFAYLLLVLTFTRSEVLVLSVGILIGAGIVHGFALALNTTLFQVVVRPNMRGRGMAVWQMSFSLMPLGALPMGFLIAQVGVQNGIALFTLGCLATFVLIAAFWRAVREL